MTVPVNFIDITGQRFNKLVAVEYLGKEIWRFKCDCGEFTEIRGSAARYGRTKSCGCLKYARKNTTHGKSHLPEYKVWAGIKARCFNPNTKSYKDYGAKGIGMSEEWKNSFETFLKDMGSRPNSTYTIERIDNFKGYSKQNCKWATRSEQNKNYSRTFFISYRGRTMCLQDWSIFLGIRRETLKHRLRKGMSTHQAFNLPLRGKNRKNQHTLMFNENEDDLNYFCPICHEVYCYDLNELAIEEMCKDCLKQDLGV